MTIQDKDADEIRIVKTIGDANKSKPGLDPVLTHESTWMLIQEEQLLKEFENLDLPAMPIRLKVRIFDEEVELTFYNTTPLEDLFTKLSDMSGIAKDQLKVKSICDAKIRRIESKNPQNTLKMLEIIDKSTITVEVKDDQDIEQE